MLRLVMVFKRTFFLRLLFLQNFFFKYVPLNNSSFKNWSFFPLKFETYLKPNLTPNHASVILSYPNTSRGPPCLSLFIHPLTLLELPLFQNNNFQRNGIYCLFIKSTSFALIHTLLKFGNIFKGTSF
jgi:hypothetical protein